MKEEIPVKGAKLYEKFEPFIMNPTIERPIFAMALSPHDLIKLGEYLQPGISPIEVMDRILSDGRVDMLAFLCATLLGQTGEIKA